MNDFLKWYGKFLYLRWFKSPQSTVAKKQDRSLPTLMGFIAVAWIAAGAAIYFTAALIDVLLGFIGI
jgi:hypothetical protein